MLSLEQATDITGQKTDSLENLALHGYLFPPHSKIVLSSKFLEFYRAYYQQGEDEKDLSLLERVALRTGEKTGDFYPLGLLVKEENYLDIYNLVTEKYPKALRTFTEGITTPRFPVLLSMTKEQLFVEYMRNPRLVDNKQFLTTWLRERSTPITISSFRQVFSDLLAMEKEEQKSVNSAILLEDALVVKKMMAFDDINFDLVNSEEILKTIIAHTPKLQQRINFSRIPLSFLRKGRGDLLELVLQKYPSALDVKTWSEYKNRDHALDPVRLALDLNDRLVSATLMSNSVPVVKRVLSSINVEYDERNSGYYQTLVRKWVSTAAETKKVKIFVAVTERFQFESGSEIVVPSFSTGNLPFIRQTMAKYGAPPNWIPCIIRAARSNSEDVFDFAIENSEETLSDKAANALIMSALESDVSIMRKVINMLKAQGKLDRISLLHPKSTIIREYAIKHMKTYTTVDMEKLRLLLENYPSVSETINSVTSMFKELASNDLNSQSIVELAVRYFDAKIVDWKSVLETASTLLNYKVVWLVSNYL